MFQPILFGLILMFYAASPVKYISWADAMSPKYTRLMQRAGSHPNPEVEERCRNVSSLFWLGCSKTHSCTQNCLSLGYSIILVLVLIFSLPFWNQHNMLLSIVWKDFLFVCFKNTSVNVLKFGDILGAKTQVFLLSVHCLGASTVCRHSTFKRHF